MTNIARLLAAVVLLGVFAEVASAQTVPRPRRKGTRYTVTIDSSPQQAAIYLDDKKYGIFAYTPFHGKLHKGQYTLIIELPGHAPYQQVITVHGRSKNFMAVLQKVAQPGVIDVQATADPNVNGAEVFVDGVNEGTAPVLINVKDGRHLVEIKKTDFEDFQQWVSVKETQTVTLTPVLKAKPKAKPKGSLLVTADVDDADVYLDGKDINQKTPAVVEDLEEGEYIVEVRKTGATTWKKTQYVKGGARTKVHAELKATMTTAAKGGKVRVLSNVATAEIFLDGDLKGNPPVDITGIKPGEHLLEAKAKGYNPLEKRIKVNEGSEEIIKFDLVAVGSSASVGGKIKVTSQEGDAKVLINGENVGTAPIEKDVAPGTHIVVVEKVGFARFEEKVSIEPGQTKTITAVLRAAGGLRFLSTPDGADVEIDGAVIGKTPMLKEDVDVGEHVVQIKLAGYYDFETSVNVTGGKLGVVNAQLRKIDTGKSAAQLLKDKWALSSFGARVMPFGRFTVDLGTGFPYWLEGRATVGVMDQPNLGWDVGVSFRSLGTNWEFMGTGRVRYFQREPFAFAFFGSLGGGGGFAGRNSFAMQLGALNTITFQGDLNAVTITGRAYLDIWSDRLCGLDDMDQPLGTGPEVCQGSDFGTASAEDLMFADQVTDNDGITTQADFHERDDGLRAVLSFVAEVAFSERLSGYLVFEGAPFQSQRAAYTDVFNGPMFKEDPIYNGKLGLTLKF